MKKLWLTYAWVDNKDQDVDHLISELSKHDLQVVFDRNTIVPGQRLWQQIDAAIADRSRTDAWAILATAQSLASEPCMEELAYALDRALRTRGSDAADALHSAFAYFAELPSRIQFGSQIETYTVDIRR